MIRQALSSALACVALLAAGGCAATINPATIQDAQTAARVKTALVNDATVGTYPIEVRVLNGVVRLSGRVPSQAAVDRAVALAKAVPGVVDVRSELRIGTTPPPEAVAGGARVRSGAEGALDDALENETRPRLLGVGASIGWNGPQAGPLGSSSSLGPLIRIGAGTGLGLSVGFGWFGTDLRSERASGELLGRVRFKPIMAGVGYTDRGDRVSTTFSLVAGFSLNGVSASETLSGREVPIAVTDSFAWRPNVTVWIELPRRTALNVSVGYLVTRPRLTLVEDGQVVRRPLRGDALMVRAGLVYQLF